MKKTLALILSVLMVVSVASLFSFSVAAETTTLIEKGSDWNYWWTDDAAAELPAGWSAADFDASDWDCGEAPFGNVYFGDRVTELNAAKSVFVLDFDVADVSALTTIIMQIRYDENPVIYINGTEVWSANNYFDGSYLTVDLSDKASAFVNGTNRIAIYLENLMGGYCFDMSLEAGSPDAVNADGYVNVKSVTKTGFYDFGSINAAENILDGNVDSCSGAGRDTSTEQSWTLTFYADVAVSEIYLHTKGKEDGAVTTNPDGITYGYYDVYVGEELVAEKAPAISKADGGYTVTLTTPITASTVKVELNGDWLGDKWANLADITIKGAVATDTPDEPVEPDTPVEPEGPTQITISPFSVGSLNGFENWPAEGTQTQLLICTTENVPVDATWVMTITNTVTGETQTITAKCDSDYDTWLRRFEVCTYEGENQFIPEVGVGYTISAEIYNEAGELIMIGTPTADPFICGEAPIVPAPETPDEPTDPDTPDEPGEDPIDPPAQTGDAAVYATIAVAVAALALVVVFKKRTNI